MQIKAQITDSWVMDETYTMRLDLNEDEYIALIQCINKSDLLKVLKREGQDRIIEKLKAFKMIKRGMKGVAAMNAREALMMKTRDKVKFAMEAMEKEGEKITAYKVAKRAKVSYNTAKKYLENKELLEAEEFITLPPL